MGAEDQVLMQERAVAKERESRAWDPTRAGHYPPCAPMPLCGDVLAHHMLACTEDKLNKLSDRLCRSVTCSHQQVNSCRSHSEELLAIEPPKTLVRPLLPKQLRG